MPNYIYKCTECDFTKTIELSISFNPKKKLLCNMCSDEHPDVRPYPEFTMTRRIGKPSFPANCNKVFAGDWFKKTYGYDIGDRATTRAELQRDIKKAEEKHKRDTEC